MVATVLGIVIGRTIRLRDRQFPEPPDRTAEGSAPYIPTQDSGERGRRGGN